MDRDGEREKRDYWHVLTTVAAVAHRAGCGARRISLGEEQDDGVE